MNESDIYTSKPWLVHYEEGVKPKLNYEDICLPEILERTVQHFPNNMALLFQGYKLSYREFHDMVNRCATWLHDCGIRKGDSVAILLPNLIPCVAAYYAILKVGGIVVMNNPLYSDRELEHQLMDSGAKLLITLDLLGDRMIDLRQRTKVKQIVYTSIGDYLPFPQNYLFSLTAKKKHLSASVKKADNVFRWKQIIAESQPKPPYIKYNIEDIAMYQYTGGTTGISKGAVLTHANLTRQLQQIAAWFPGFESGNEIMLGALPFFHIFGLTTAMNLAVYKGWGNILVPKPQPRQLLEAISKYHPTFAPLVPTMYIGILDDPGIDTTDLTSIKGCFSGSAPLPVEVINEFESKTGAVIVEGFGLTETSPVTHTNPFSGKRKVGSIGLPLPDTECRIVDLSEGVHDVPVGEPGELIVKGPQVMAAYLNQPNETANVLKDGWLFTGDIATMDQDGYFYIVDRKKDMIISGGYNVYPREIEDILQEHPKVKEVCAVGRPHAQRGEVIKVFVVLKNGEKIMKEELMEYCKNKLARYKWPLELEFREELPKTNIGKLLRKSLKEEELQRYQSL